MVRCCGGLCGIFDSDKIGMPGRTTPAIGCGRLTPDVAALCDLLIGHDRCDDALTLAIFFVLYSLLFGQANFFFAIERLLLGLFISRQFFFERSLFFGFNLVGKQFF